jgi:hypothetical protein
MSSAQIGLCRRESKHVLSAFAVTSATEMQPGFAIERALKAVRSSCSPVAPVDFETPERRDLAEVDLQPRLLQGIADPSCRVMIVDGEPRTAAARGYLPAVLGKDVHRTLELATGRRGLTIRLPK